MIQFKTLFLKYKKPVIMAGSGVVIFCALVFVLWGSGIIGNKTARLEIDIEGKKRVFEGEVVRGMTILEALQASTAAGNISMDYSLAEGNHVVIRSLDGFDSKESQKSLFFYLNSNPIELDKIHSVSVSPGDNISVVVK